MEHIGAHLSDKSPRKRDRATERGELMRYFLKEVNRARVRDGLPPMSMARMGKTLELISTDNLYYVKSVCDDQVKRGGEFSKKFWWEVKLKFKNSTKKAQ
jgi:hypothetical protein